MLSEQIVEMMSDGDYVFDKATGIANFVIKIGRKGTGLSTSIQFCLRFLANRGVTEFERIKDTAQMSLLLEGKHPLIQKTEFKQSSVDEDLEF